MNDYELQCAVTDAVGSMALKALNHFEEDSVDDAAAILGEWTTEGNECILTHHYLNTVQTISDPMMYWFNDKDQYGYGKFYLNPNIELVD